MNVMIEASRPGDAARRGEERLGRGIPAGARAQVPRGVARAADDVAGGGGGGGGGMERKEKEKGISCCD